MPDRWITAPVDPGRYVLGNVRIPPNLCALPRMRSGWCDADILIEDGRISAIAVAGDLAENSGQYVDAGRSIVFSGLVDCHTHLDKAHVSAFADFPPTDLAGAIQAMAANKKSWTPDRFARRVNFSLKTAYAYGVRAMRSHADFSPDAPEFVLPELERAADDWAGKIELQLSPLANINNFDDPNFRHHIYAAASKTGRIGMFLFDQTGLVEKLRPVFEHANAQGWDIDLHVDEGMDARLDGLRAVAETVLSSKFRGTVLCGHCVALNAYSEERRAEVIAIARQAGVHFVALPVTNLYLQGREKNGMPQFRGMAPVRALANSGALVSFGADNVRDGFCAFGDFDPMTVLNLGAQIGHLDNPARDWSSMITRNPAKTMGLDWDGIIAAGAPADLVVFEGRNSGEISARPSPNRVVIRNGCWINQVVPDFRELKEDV